MSQVRQPFMDNEGSSLRCPTNIDTIVLAANVPQLYTVDSTKSHIMFSATADFNAQYFTSSMPSDIVTNGAMASDTGWTKGTGVTIAAGIMSFDGTQDASNGLTVQTPPAGYLLNGQNYYCTLTTTRSAGSIALLVGGTAGTSRSTASTFNEIIKAGSGTTIGFQPDADFVGSVDAVTFIPCATIATANNLTGNSSELNPIGRYMYDEDLNRIVRISLVSASTPIINIAKFKNGK